MSVDFRASVLDEVRSEPPELGAEYVGGVPDKGDALAGGVP